MSPTNYPDMFAEGAPKPAPGEVDRVATALLQRIVSGDYPAGLRLPPEVSLAREFGCSRSTLREALRHLTGLGLVKSRRGSGVLVLDFRRQGTFHLLPAYLAAGRFDLPPLAIVEELLRMRRLLAVEAARLAALYASPASIAALRPRVDELEALEGDPVQHTRREIDLFRDLLHASSMWPAVWFANAFWEPMLGLHDLFSASVGFVPPGHATMLRTLFSLLERREAKRAVTLVEAHFTKIDETLLPRAEKLLAAASIARAQ